MTNQFIYHKLDHHIWYFLLPVSDYHYGKITIANLLLFVKLVDKYYIICNTRVNDAIYVQGKDDEKYLQF